MTLGQAHAIADHRSNSTHAEMLDAMKLLEGQADPVSRADAFKLGRQLEEKVCYSQYPLHVSDLSQLLISPSMVNLGHHCGLATVNPAWIRQTHG